MIRLGILLILGVAMANNAVGRTTVGAEKLLPPLNYGSDRKVMLVPDFPTLAESVAAAREDDTYQALIGQLNQSFIDEGLVVLSLLEQDAVQRNRAFIYGEEVSADPFTFFCSFAPCEVFVYVRALQIAHDNGDRQLSFSLRAVDKYSYQNLAHSAEFKSYRRSNPSVAQQCVAALRQQDKMKQFYQQLKETFRSNHERGRAVSFRAEIAGKVPLSLESEIRNEPLVAHLMRVIRGPLADKLTERPRQTSRMLEVLVHLPPVHEGSLPYTILDYGVDCQRALSRVLKPYPLTVKLKVVETYVSLHLEPEINSDEQH